MTSRISLDYTCMTAAAVSGGVDDSEWRELAASFGAARAATTARYARGELGFIDLPSQHALLDAAQERAARILETSVRDAVVLGIGGSALGPIALRTALRPSGWNGLTDNTRGGFPRLHVLDNVDPVTMAGLLERIDLRTTAFVVTSKSGGTAETMAQYLVVRGRLESRGLSPRDHLTFLTDPERGALRRIAKEESIPVLDIPPNVGGRFSVLSAVGVLPAFGPFTGLHEIDEGERRIGVGEHVTGDPVTHDFARRGGALERGESRGHDAQRFIARRSLEEGFRVV